MKNNIMKKLAPLIEFFEEFKKDKTGVVGLCILVLAILVSLFEPLLLTYKEAPKRWRDITYWQDNPASAAPQWLNFFQREKSAITADINPISVETNYIDNQLTYKAVFEYDYKFDKSPVDLIFHANVNGSAASVWTVTRPDGAMITLSDSLHNINGDLRISAFNDSKNRIFRFYRDSVPRMLARQIDILTTNPMKILFNTKKDDMAKDFKALKGIYKFEVLLKFSDNNNTSFENPYMVLVGSMSGIMGTDNMKRDIFSGLVSGLKWALFIGIATSFISVIIGVMYGIVSAYFGGIVDNIMQFIYQIFIGIPVLPVMIVMSAIFKPSICTMIMMMIFFSWTGSVMTVRSMAMQLKEETYIEAARTIGAGHFRIIFNHLAPLLLPFSFASMALAVPSAIVYESSLSLLGLGDASIVTWGQILHDAMKGSAVLSGLWWWIIPPGILIAILGMSFAFLGFALDKILHPKLRSR
ncbi:ABC transporter permease [uncultured Brachyspira sp.]|uniref:ABC transporter permease n=1 Tax=uncultured Brachyspira sp. TaxID=221953 RepID=UPI002632AAD8|nr:ABC transporter permease [uncultured Brachyspira sp.]